MNDIDVSKKVVARHMQVEINKYVCHMIKHCEISKGCIDADVARHLEMDRCVFSKKIRSIRFFTFFEIIKIAQFFSVDINTFISPDQFTSILESENAYD